nr:adenylyltransferase/cytidyltransferase family protein [Microterricola viridarii]
MRHRVGYAGGAFDMFHVGHLNILRHAKSQCDYLIAGVVSDEVLLHTRGSAAVVPLAERLEIVRHISFVDEAVAETALDKLETWQRVGFDIYFKGDDWKGTERGHALEFTFADIGVEVVYFPYTITTASSALRRALDAVEIGCAHPQRAAESRPPNWGIGLDRARRRLGNDKS